LGPRRLASGGQCLVVTPRRPVPWKRACLQSRPRGGGSGNGRVGRRCSCAWTVRSAAPLSPAWQWEWRPPGVGGCRFSWRGGASPTRFALAGGGNALWPGYKSACARACSQTQSSTPLQLTMGSTALRVLRAVGQHIPCRIVLKAHALARGGPVAGRVPRLGHASCFATHPPSSFGYGFGPPPGAVLVGSSQHPPNHPGPPPAARPQRALRSPEGGMLCVLRPMGLSCVLCPMAPSYVPWPNGQFMLHYAQGGIQFNLNRHRQHLNRPRVVGPRPACHALSQKRA